MSPHPLAFLRAEGWSVPAGGPGSSESSSSTPYRKSAPSGESHLARKAQVGIALQHVHLDPMLPP